MGLIAPVLVLLLQAAPAIPECEPGYVHMLPLCVRAEAAAPVGMYAGEGTERWRPWVEIYFNAWDVERALRIIECESHGNPNATNPRSGAAGLFQHMPRYWDERSEQYGWDGWGPYGVDANVAIAAHLVYDSAGGWGHWNASRSCWS